MGEIRSILGGSGVPAVGPYRSADFVDFFMFAAPLSNSYRQLSCGRTHSTDAHQVVGHPDQAHQLLIAPDTAQPGYTQTADALALSKELLDPFAHDLTGPIARGLEDAPIGPVPK